MSLVLVGIDEAGYGPLLGPLCVGMSAFRVNDWSEGDAAPDLWRMLGAGVCRKAGDARGRVAIEDSKKLKLSNDGRRHPLTHLERAVLAQLRTMGRTVADDIDLLDALVTELEPAAWYGDPPSRLPVAHDDGSLQIACNVLARTYEEAGVTPLMLRCTAVCESRFNSTVRERGSKAATTEIALLEHLAQAWRNWGGEVEAPRVVCDRQGGRIEYGDLLKRFLCGCGAADGRIEILEEQPERSRYAISGLDGGVEKQKGGASRRRLIVAFQPEAETAHLPVALASMTAKFTREVIMARFNRYWAGRAALAGLAEPKPTAGYWSDGQRWLRDMTRVMSKEERKAMVRIA